MGIDAGFDMVPKLSQSEYDEHKWARFLRLVQDHYEEDSNVQTINGCIVFQAGEHPRLPYAGHKFLRFTSTISGSHAQGVEEYIRTVTEIARECFGERVLPWSELREQHGHYGWDEVHASKASD